MEGSVSAAVTDFDAILRLLEGKEKSKVGASFRARCRELPSLMEDAGFISALSFCYAKATKNIYKEIRENIKNNKSISEKDDTNKKGYGIYLYMVLKRLKELGLIQEDALDNPIEALKELEYKWRAASKLLMPYLAQLKRLSEAIFEAEGEES
jgi:CRISPR type III-B/RAMP module-associated protein Cmr5